MGGRVPLVILFNTLYTTRRGHYCGITAAAARAACLAGWLVRYTCAPHIALPQPCPSAPRVAPLPRRLSSRLVYAHRTHYRGIAAADSPVLKRARTRTYHHTHLHLPPHAR